MQKRSGTALHSYKKKRWGAVLSAGEGTGSKGVTDNSNGYAIHNNKGDQVSSIAASWAICHHMIMGPPEESILIAQMVIKLGLSTTKIKYLTGIYDQSKRLPFVFRSELHVNVGPIKIRTSPLTTTKADLLFLFVNEMK